VSRIKAEGGETNQGEPKNTPDSDCPAREEKGKTKTGPRSKRGSDKRGTGGSKRKRKTGHKGADNGGVLTGKKEKKNERKQEEERKSRTQKDCRTKGQNQKKIIAA